MKNGRFHPSKCRSKAKKMEVLYTHFPKITNPFLTTPKTYILSKKIGKRGGAARYLLDIRQATIGRRPHTGARN